MTNHDSAFPPQQAELFEDTADPKQLPSLSPLLLPAQKQKALSESSTYYYAFWLLNLKR